MSTVKTSLTKMLSFRKSYQSKDLCTRSPEANSIPSPRILYVALILTLGMARMDNGLVLS